MNETLAHQLALFKYGTQEHPVLPSLIGLNEAASLQGGIRHPVLLFDTRLSASNLLGFWLKKLAYQFEHVDTPEILLERIRKNCYEMVLFDLCLAGKDSLSLIKRIITLQDELGTRTPIFGMGFAGAGTTTVAGDLSGYINKSELATSFVSVVGRIYPLASANLCSPDDDEILDEFERKKLLRAPSDFSIAQHLVGFPDTQLALIQGTLKTILSCLDLAFEEQNTESLLIFSNSLLSLNEHLRLPWISNIAACLREYSSQNDWNSIEQSLAILRQESIPVIEHLEEMGLRPWLL